MDNLALPTKVWTKALTGVTSASFFLRSKEQKTVAFKLDYVATGGDAPAADSEVWTFISTEKTDLYDSPLSISRDEAVDVYIMPMLSTDSLITF